LYGKIALAKYGGPFRGVKVQNAEAYGMVGVIIFSDPGDDGPQVAKGQAAYPSMLRISRDYASFEANLS
jgi:N-acetylated-alpha-linked acidic dipeptidase